MAEIFLPRRTGGIDSRRPAATPTAANVPSVPLASDPGLDVRVQQFGDFSGGEAIGEAIVDTSDVVGKEIRRQQKLQDATEASKIRTKFAQAGQAQLDIASTQGNLGDEAQRQLFHTFLDNEKIDALRSPEGNKLSPEARATLELSLDEISFTLKSQAVKSHLKAMETKGVDILLQSRNAAANRSGLKT